MNRFMRRNGFDNYGDLYRWSIDDIAGFWEAVCDFFDVRFDKQADDTICRPGNIMDAGWFSGSELNFASHLLRYSGDQAAIIFCGEDGSRSERTVPRR
jgi:acetoacetyl-CoA synthetase